MFIIIERKLNINKWLLCCKICRTDWSCGRTRVSGNDANIDVTSSEYFLAYLKRKSIVIAARNISSSLTAYCRAAAAFMLQFPHGYICTVREKGRVRRYLFLTKAIPNSITRCSLSLWSPPVLVPISPSPLLKYFLFYFLTAGHLKPCNLLFVPQPYQV